MWASRLRRHSGRLRPKPFGLGPCGCRALTLFFGSASFYVDFDTNECIFCVKNDICTGGHMKKKTTDWTAGITFAKCQCELCTGKPVKVTTPGPDRKINQGGKI
jgi:hypothetical protein